MTRLAGGRAIVRPGAIVTPAPGCDDMELTKWQEWRVDAIVAGRLELKAPNGLCVCNVRVDEMRLTSHSELQARAQLAGVVELVGPLVAAQEKRNEGRACGAIYIHSPEYGREWHANGHTIKLGHYAIDSIDAQGTLRAGCHTFSKAEVLRIGELIGGAK